MAGIRFLGDRSLFQGGIQCSPGMAAPSTSPIYEDEGIMLAGASKGDRYASPAAELASALWPELCDVRALMHGGFMTSQYSWDNEPGYTLSH